MIRCWELIPSTGFFGRKCGGLKLAESFDILRMLYKDILIGIPILINYSYLKIIQSFVSGLWSVFLLYINHNGITLGQH